MSIGEKLLNGLSGPILGLMCTLMGGALVTGINMHSDINMLKADSARMQQILIDQTSLKTDVKVLQTEVGELRQNVIFLNTALTKATDKMNEVLIKLERKVDMKQGS